MGEAQHPNEPTSESTPPPPPIPSHRRFLAAAANEYAAWDYLVQAGSRVENAEPMAVCPQCQQPTMRPAPRVSLCACTNPQCQAHNVPERWLTHRWIDTPPSLTPGEWLWIAQLFSLEVTEVQASAFLGMPITKLRTAYAEIRMSLCATFLPADLAHAIHLKSDLPLRETTNRNWVEKVAAKMTAEDSARAKAERREPVDARKPGEQLAKEESTESAVLVLGFVPEALGLRLADAHGRHEYEQASRFNHWAGVLTYTYAKRDFTLLIRLSHSSGDLWRRGLRKEKPDPAAEPARPRPNGAPWNPRRDGKWRWLLQRVLRFGGVAEHRLELQFCELVVRYNALHHGVRPQDHVSDVPRERRPLFTDYFDAIVYSLLQKRAAISPRRWRSQQK